MSDTAYFGSASARATTPPKQAALRLRGGRRTPLVRYRSLDFRVLLLGYEIPFNRHFYVFEPPRSLADIDADLKLCTDRIKTMIDGLSA